MLVLAPVVPARAVTYYVRQTLGDDAHDGTSAATAWQHVSKLSGAMHAGDTAYVGPGLYRDGIFVANDGTPDAPITFHADSTGRYTGDPPGIVMITGAEPVDETIFAPHALPGVYTATFSDFPVEGVVEMDGDQRRYLKVTITKEYLVDKLPPVDIVGRYPRSYFYDESSHVLSLHTSDDRPPTDHEMELIQRSNGIGIVGKHFVTVEGFTFRHTGDSGVSFFQGSSDGIAIGNTSWGSRQGIRIYTATNIRVIGNTLFRNENCGVYLAAGSVGGSVIGNVAYENVKGVRWGSKSVNGIAADNVLFDNFERGLAIEDTKNVVAWRNRLVNNKVSQLLGLMAEYDSDANCFQNGAPDQAIADFYFADRYATLAAYQQAKHRDLDSREGGCDPLPAKVDVHALHARTTGYADCARRVAGGATESCDAPAPGRYTGMRAWLRRFFSGGA